MRENPVDGWWRHTCGKEWAFSDLSKKNLLEKFGKVGKIGKIGKIWKNWKLFFEVGIVETGLFEFCDKFLLIAFIRAKTCKHILLEFGLFIKGEILSGSQRGAALIFQII